MYSSSTLFSLCAHLFVAFGKGFLQTTLPVAFSGRLSEPSETFRIYNTEGIQEEDAGGEEEPIVKSTVKIDDHGSDLTNRFKYKVNALMGVFDPANGVDDERQEGNILNGKAAKTASDYSTNSVLIWS